MQVTRISLAVYKNAKNVNQKFQNVDQTPRIFRYKLRFHLTRPAMSNEEIAFSRTAFKV